MIDADPELAALLAACRARPADDLARLVLADYLEERNQHERAELIRLQVELSHKSSDIEHQRQLKRREKELIAEHGSTWLGPSDSVEQVFSQLAVAPHSIKKGMIHAELRRVDTITSLDFLNWLNSPYADWLESVKIKLTLEQFLRIDIPDQLHGRIDLDLNFGIQSRRNALEQFFMSSNATMLRELTLNGFMQHMRFPKTNPLDVSHLVSFEAYGREDFVDFVATEQFSSLSSLTLDHLTTDSIRKLCQSPHLRNLVSLKLEGSPIGDDGMEMLCASPMADTLREVEFPNTKMGNRGLMALVKSPIIQQMYGPTLNLMMNRISDVGLSELADCPYLDRFDGVVLRENDIGDAGIVALADSPHVRNLRYLDLWRNRITDRGAKALAASPYLKSIVDLSVKENRLSQVGANALINRFGNCVKV